MADPTVQYAEDGAGGVLAVIDQHELDRRVRALLRSHEIPEGSPSPVRTKLAAREHLLKKWVLRLGSRVESGRRHDDGVIIFPAVGAVYLPSATLQALFRREAPPHAYAQDPPGKLFSRIAMPMTSSVGSSWHLAAFTVPGAGAGVRIGIADSGFDPSRTSARLAGFQAFDASGAETTDVAQDFDAGLHGTQVASFAASQTEGVLPEAQVVVAAVLTLNGGHDGAPMQIAAGLDWLGRQDLDVVNCSFGAPGCESTWYTIIQNMRLMDIVVVAGIGNEPGDPLFPGRFHNVVAVGAADMNGNPGSFSATGLAADALGNPLSTPKPDVYRPGVNLFGAVKCGTISGTSFASPMAAAQLAQVLRGHTDLPEDASLIMATLSAQLKTLSPGAPGQDPPHDCEPGGDMSTNYASAIQVDPVLLGYRIEDPVGTAIGAHTGQAAIHTWGLETAGGGDVWPATRLTLHPIVIGGSLGWTPQAPNYQSALGSMFANSQTMGALPTLAQLGADRRYLVKNGPVVVALVAVSKDGTGQVHEFGNPLALIDNRLPLTGNGRYYPNAVLTLVPMKPVAPMPPWGGYLAVI